ncbi:MAG: glycosyltransferase [Bdellovibrionales bacterium]|nr:glycosyltransferase [Bdellovibrionales bacterium]
MTIDRIQRHPQYGKKLIYLKDCDDRELQYCYSIASGLIFASLCEGFGLPLLEAMFHGIPVVCSDIPVLEKWVEITQITLIFRAALLSRKNSLV